MSRKRRLQIQAPHSEAGRENENRVAVIDPLVGYTMVPTEAYIMDQILNNLSRRSFLRNSSAAGVSASAFTILRPELVRGAGKEKLKAGLIGCGGRGDRKSVV